MIAKEIILHINPDSHAQLEALASAREISVETLILEALDQYLQSKQWAAFDKDIQALMRENADLMRRLARKLMVYPTLGQVIRINANVLMGKFGVRDSDVLESAVARPQASAFGQDAYPTVYEKAAALLHSLVLNHPFVDGNKRTATLVTLLFLRLNGVEKNWLDENAYWFVIAVANGRRSVQQAATWLRGHTTVKSETNVQP